MFAWRRAALKALVASRAPCLPHGWRTFVAGLGISGRRCRRSDAHGSGNALEDPASPASPLPRRGAVEGLAVCVGRFLGPVEAFLSPRFVVKGLLEQNRRIASVLHAAR